MNQPIRQLPDQSTAWRWPIDLAVHDRTPSLSEAERSELDRRLGQGMLQIRGPSKAILHRLVRPLHDALILVHPTPSSYNKTIRLMLIEMHRRGTAFWGWTLEEWCESICPSNASFLMRHGRANSRHHHDARPYLPYLAYLLCPLPTLDPLLERVEITPLARKVFGEERIGVAVQRLRSVLSSWGYQQKEQRSFDACVGYLLLRNRSPHLEDLSSELLDAVDQTCTLPCVQRTIYQISRALHALGAINRPLPTSRGAPRQAMSGTDGTISNAWLSWCDRWRKQATQRHKESIYYPLLKVGRWLKVHHPEVSSPADFTYELAAEFVAAVNEMTVGEWSDASRRTRLPADRIGRPLRPTAKNRLLEAMRVFLRDCQEWRWIAVQLNPARAFRTPTSIRHLIGPDPRVVERGLWAKLLWAAMNLEATDLPLRGNGNELPVYPVEMVRAIAVVWCFAALRSDEIVRLRVGCVRRQREDVMVPETGDILPRDAVCFLDIPVNKTSTAYTKPVHPLVGKRINEWERVRPKDQLRELDSKTSEPVQFLFSYRGTRISKSYINAVLIPVLCRKANIPAQDSRGTITSHRARATIASMLYNAKEPLDIFQLKEYLGHRQLTSTQSYLKVDPTKLASQVAKAGYLEQNLATIEVLLDQNAVMSGRASRGEPWKFYDLGHGYCTNPFWADCAHRMACARCPYYCPKNSLREQLVEGQANLVRMLEFVQLTEDEKLLVNEGVELHQELIEKLTDVPTPAGPTPRELEAQRQGATRAIPIKHVRRTGSKQEEP